MCVCMCVGVCVIGVGFRSLSFRSGKRRKAFGKAGLLGVGFVVCFFLRSVFSNGPGVIANGLQIECR